MITKPMDVLEKYEIRKSRRQKTAFITAVSAYAASQRFACRVEKGSFGCRNIVIGDPERAQYLITAHYDTCAWMPLPNLVTPFNLLTFCLYQILLVFVLAAGAAAAGLLTWVLTHSQFWGVQIGMVAYWALLICMMVGPANRHTANDNTSGVVTLLEIMASLPENLRSKVCFVLFDLEEAGLIGSAAYRKAHKAATDRQTVLNMDCVGDGDEVVLIPNKRLRRDAQAMAALTAISGTWGRKSLTVHQKGFALYPSDQANFPRGVAIAAFRRNRWAGLYYSRIHTHRDRVLEHTNVNLLRAAIISLVGNNT